MIFSFSGPKALSAWNLGRRRVDPCVCSSRHCLLCATDDAPTLDMWLWPYSCDGVGGFAHAWLGAARLTSYVSLHTMSGGVPLNTVLRCRRDLVGSTSVYGCVQLCMIGRVRLRTATGKGKIWCGHILVRQNSVRENLEQNLKYHGKVWYKFSKSWVNWEVNQGFPVWKCSLLQLSYLFSLQLTCETGFKVKK